MPLIGLRIVTFCGTHFIVFPDISTEVRVTDEEIVIATYNKRSKEKEKQNSVRHFYIQLKTTLRSRRVRSTPTGCRSEIYSI